MCKHRHRVTEPATRPSVLPRVQRGWDGGGGLGPHAAPPRGDALPPLLLPLIKAQVSLLALSVLWVSSWRWGRAGSLTLPSSDLSSATEKILPFPKLLSPSPSGLAGAAAWGSSPARHLPAPPGRTGVLGPAPCPRCTPGTSGAKKWISSSRSLDLLSTWATCGGSLTSATRTEGVRMLLGLLTSGFGGKKPVCPLSDAENSLFLCFVGL